MLKSITLGPFKVGGQGFFDSPEGERYGVDIESTNPDSPFECITTVESNPDPSIDDVKAQQNDAAFIVEAINLYPKFVELLESIEAQSQDKAACRKIREFMKEEGLW